MLWHRNTSRDQQNYLHGANPDAALPHLKKAYELRSEDEPIVREYQALLAYLTGRDALAE